MDLLAEYHGVTVQPIDVADAEASRAEINSWVSDQTAGLIPDLLPAGFIDANTQLVLTDAIHFKAQWEKIFGTAPPLKTTFTLLDGSTTPIELMRNPSLQTSTTAGDGWIAAELGYLGGDWTMTILSLIHI